MINVSGNILAHAGFVRGALTYIAPGRNDSIQGAPMSEAAARSNVPLWVLPGFFDLHAHGAGGRDVMQGGDPAHMVKAMSAVTAVCRTREVGGAHLLAAGTWADAVVMDADLQLKSVFVEGQSIDGV